MSRRLTLNNRALRRELADGTALTITLLDASPVMVRLCVDSLDFGQAVGHVLIDVAEAVEKQFGKSGGAVHAHSFGKNTK